MRWHFTFFIALSGAAPKLADPDFHYVRDVAAENVIQRVAVATLVANTAYIPGAIALAASVRDQDPTVPLVCVTIVAEEGASGGVDHAGVQWIEHGGWLVHEVPSSLAVRCSPSETGSMARFTLGCTKLHLWSLADFDQVLYLDADSFVRPSGGFNARATLHQFRDVAFAAKPTPPDSKLCGGRVAQEHQRSIQRQVSVTFHTPQLGLVFSTSPGGGLVVSECQLPASGLSVAVGWQLMSIGRQKVPQNAQPSAIANLLAHTARPVTLSFRPPSEVARAVSNSIGIAKSAELDLLLRNDSSIELSQVELSHSTELWHSCTDLFNTNIMVLQPNPRTFQLLVHALEDLKAQGPSAIDATAFDSGFLSRFFGHYYEASPGRWLPFDRHLEVSLSPVHWPYHSSVPKDQVPMVAWTSTFPNLLAWSQIASIDFSGPSALKPWAILNAAYERAQSVPNSSRIILANTWAAVDAALSGGDGQHRRPIVDFYLTIWLQWLQQYHQGCIYATANGNQLLAAKDSLVCYFDSAYLKGFLP